MIEEGVEGEAALEPALGAIDFGIEGDDGLGERGLGIERVGAEAGLVD